ncbi:MAG: 30S ribosomal protein S5 [Planctomycetes bacterium]|nr:30S ribosomal protein S5 [Planctomycetota bacterium]
MSKKGPREEGDSPRRRRGGDDEQEVRSDFEERVVKINRSTKVMKGGRRFSFSALVVYGNRKGTVGFGFGKSNDVPSAIEKAVSGAKKSLEFVDLKDHRTIHHVVEEKFGAAKVRLLPASAGTGLIAGAAVRAVLELAGVKDVLTKCYGSTNPLNVVKATLGALKATRSKKEIERLRGVELHEVHN